MSRRGKLGERLGCGHAQHWRSRDGWKLGEGPSCGCAQFDLHDHGLRGGRRHGHGESLLGGINGDVERPGHGRCLCNSKGRGRCLRNRRRHGRGRNWHGVRQGDRPSSGCGLLGLGGLLDCRRHGCGKSCATGGLSKGLVAAAACVASWTAAGTCAGRSSEAPGRAKGLVVTVVSVACQRAQTVGCWKRKASWPQRRTRGRARRRISIGREEERLEVEAKVYVLSQEVQRLAQGEPQDAAGGRV